MDISYERVASCMGVTSLVVAAFLLAGCGDDDGEGAAETAGDDDSPAPSATTELPTAQSTTPETIVDDEVTTTGGSSDEGDVVNIVLSDYAFDGVPESVPAGTKLQVENVSKEELHELVVMPIPEDEDRPVEELVTLPEDELDAVFGDVMPAAVLLAPPGGEQIEAVGDGTLDEPGRYALVCFIPTGADPDEYMEAAANDEGPPDVQGGPPHVVHGMYAELLVE